MQAWKHLRQWSVPSPITPCFTPAPWILVNWIRSGLMAVANLEVHMGDHDLLDYCTIGLQAVNDAQNVTVDIACGKDHNQQNLSKTIT